MKKYLPLLLLLPFGLGFGPSRPADTPPNVIYILADDMGYGDVSSYNPQGRLRTPHIDALARRGMRFTDAHTSSAVCSPTGTPCVRLRYTTPSRAALPFGKGLGSSSCGPAPAGGVCLLPRS